jgi:hypothetical protein
MSDNFNIHNWNLKRIIEDNSSEADIKAKKRVDIMFENILNEFPNLFPNDMDKSKLRFAISSGLTEMAIQRVLTEEAEGYSNIIGKTKGLTPEELDTILTIIAKGEDNNQIDESQENEYTVEYWYRWGDNEKDFGTINIKASSEKEAIKKAEREAPRTAKGFKIIK